MSTLNGYRSNNSTVCGTLQYSIICIKVLYCNQLKRKYLKSLRKQFCCCNCEITRNANTEIAQIEIIVNHAAHASLHRHRFSIGHIAKRCRLHASLAVGDHNVATVFALRAWRQYCVRLEFRILAFHAAQTHLCVATLLIGRWCRGRRLIGRRRLRLGRPLDCAMCDARFVGENVADQLSNWRKFAYKSTVYLLGLQCLGRSLRRVPLGILVLGRHVVANVDEFLQ